MTDKRSCEGCRDATAFSIPFTMAFQPIIDRHSGALFAYEALVRGRDGGGAWSVLQSVDETNRYAFDQQCRVKAIELAAELGMIESGALLSINFMPNAVYEPRACIRLTVETAARVGFPLSRLLFEFTETEKMDAQHVKRIIEAYRAMGMKTAIDDFGSGYSDLGLLAQFQPDVIKLDMELIREIETSDVKAAIVRASRSLADDLGITLLAEGVETDAESEAVASLGIPLQQGYLFARPAVGELPLLSASGISAATRSAA